MPTLTPDRASALPGPDWLRARRAAAAERFAAASLPTEAEEIWRYSRISELDLDVYRAPDPEADVGPVPETATRAAGEVGERAGLVVFANGSLVHTEIAPELEARGVVVGSLAEQDNGDEALGAAAPSSTDVFTELNLAFVAPAV